MGSAPLLFLGGLPIAMLLVSVYLNLLFRLIIVSFFLSVFLFRCVLHPLPLPLPLCLGCIPPLIGLPFLRFMRLPLVCFYCLSDFVCVFYLFIYCLSRRCTLLATFLSVLFCLLSLLISEISGLIWLGFVYLVTTVRFVADQLMRDKQQTTTIQILPASDSEHRPRRGGVCLAYSDPSGER